mgnify:FL=1
MQNLTLLEMWGLSNTLNTDRGLALIKLSNTLNTDRGLALIKFYFDNINVLIQSMSELE